jgi:hypothetical protein
MFLCKFLNIFADYVGSYIFVYVRHQAERIGPLSLNPSTMDVSPLPVPRACYALATLQLPDTQLRSYTI